MANKHKGETSFVSDGKAYILRYDVNAICDLEDKTGKTVSVLIEELGGDNVSMRLVRSVFASGISPEVDEKTAGAIMSELGMAEVTGLIGQAFQLAFPDANENPPKATGKAA